MNLYKSVLVGSLCLVLGFCFYFFGFPRTAEDFQSINVTGVKWGNLSKITATNNGKYSDIDLNDKIVAIFFGYLACPDFCPNHLSKMVVVKNGLPDKIKEEFAVVFISVDPQRDTTNDLKKFIRSFDSSFDGFVPSESHLNQLMDEFKLVVNKNPINGSEAYLIDHFTYTYLFDKNKNLRLLIPIELSIEAIISDIKKVAMDQRSNRI